MKINDGLNVYEDQIDEQQKSIYKYCLFVFLVCLTISIVISVIFENSYPLVISYIVGSLVSIFLYYITSKLINDSYYLDLKKAVKKIHVIYQITYIISFAVLLIFFRSYFSIIGLVSGLLLVKFGIFIHNLFVKIK